MVSDVICRWMAETGSGSIRALRGKLTWLARTEDRDISTFDSGRWLRDLSSLAHAELEWDRDVWAAAPLVLTRLPGADGLAILAGVRTRKVDSALDDLDLEVHRVGQPGNNRLDRPTAIMLQYDTADELAKAAAQVGALYVPCAAEQLAARLSRIQLGEPAAPPSRENETLEKWDAGNMDWQAVSSLASHEPGLYQLLNAGRKQWLFLTEGGWVRCGLSAGVFTELKRTGHSAMRWRAERGAGRDRFGQVFVDWGAPLPPLQQRALVLCSGVVPRFSDGARTAIYDSVPLRVAEQTAASLGQRLEPT